MDQVMDGHWECGSYFSEVLRKGQSRVVTFELRSVWRGVSWDQEKVIQVERMASIGSWDGNGSGLSNPLEIIERAVVEAQVHFLTCHQHVPEPAPWSFMLDISSYNYVYARMLKELNTVKYYSFGCSLDSLSQPSLLSFFFCKVRVGRGICCNGI